jgi:hypothetical protein
MSVDTRLQVFLSSTSNDLAVERADLLSRIQAHDYFVAGMEQWPASAVRTAEFLQNKIKQSDYVVLVSAGQYGSLMPDYDISYTEFEYEYAISTGKVVLIFLRKNSQELIDQLAATDADGAARLHKFHERLKNSARPVKMWSSSAELAGEVIRALQESGSAKENAGWIRIDQIDKNFADQATETKIANLEGTVYSLWARFNEIRRNVQEHARQLPEVSGSRAPDISGRWECTTKHTIQTIYQRYNQIASRHPTGAFDHYMRGWWSRDHFSYDVWRINLDTNNFTIMQSKIHDITYNSFKSTIVGTDGFQELEYDFRENLEWRRLSTLQKSTKPEKPRRAIFRFTRK